MLNAFQLNQLATGYYTNGYLLGRDALYEHMKSTYPAPNMGPLGPNTFHSRDDTSIAELLKKSVVSQRFQYQRMSKSVSSMIPIRPFHSVSLDLIDKSKKTNSNVLGANNLVVTTYKHIFVLVDNFSRYMTAYPLTDKRPETLVVAFNDFNTNLFVKFPYLS